MSIVLNFHNVNDSSWLENILNFLKKKYSIVSLTELTNSLSNDKIGKIHCHITIDDGDRTFYKIILPVLEKLKITATVFVSSELAINQKNYWFQEIVGYDQSKLIKIFSEATDMNYDIIKEFPVYHLFKCITIDLILEIINRYQEKYKPDKKPFQNMSVSELHEVEDSGLITIGAHTLRHPVLANEEIQVSRNEIIGSITGLAGILGHKIECFAYPNGEPELDFGQREIDILKEAGCKYSLSTYSGNFTSGCDLLSIPRFGLSSGESIPYLMTKIFFGSHWNTLIKLKPGNEFKNRKAILHRMKKR